MELEFSGMCELGEMIFSLLFMKTTFTEWGKGTDPALAMQSHFYMLLYLKKNLIPCILRPDWVT